MWLFTGVFLPLFVVLGFWQLNRAAEKEQLLARAETAVVFADINWQQPPLSQPVVVSGELLHDSQFYLDNKTHHGQFGYELWQLLQTPSGVVAASLGWVAGSQDRRQLPNVIAHSSLHNQAAMVRAAPTNPLFGVEANSLHQQGHNNWVVQSLTLDWLTQHSAQPVIGFVQLLDADQTGVGVNIWQPTVMSPEKHLGYAMQWFGMASALLAMFIYAGFKPTMKIDTRSKHKNNNLRNDT